MSNLTELEQAVDKVIEAKEDWALALARYAVAQYKQELATRLGKLALLLDDDVIVHSDAGSEQVKRKGGG